jgi:diphthamide biosynthesis protein 2
MQIALQFPDDQLHVAYDTCRRLQRGLAAAEATPRMVFVLGDTSYAPCCVDEVAAAHLEADAIVHYGPACLSTPPRTPAFYVFDRAPLDVEAVAASLVALLGCTNAAAAPRYREVLLLWQSSYAHAIPAVLAAVGRALPEPSSHAAAVQPASPSAGGGTLMVALPSPHPRLRVPVYRQGHAGRVADVVAPADHSAGPPTAPTAATGLLHEFGGLSFTPPVPLPGEGEEMAIVHLGAHPPRLRSLVYAAGASNVVLLVWDPAAAAAGGGRPWLTTAPPADLPKPICDTASPLSASSRILTAAFIRVEAIKRAQRVGIVSGTFGVAGHAELADRVAQACKRAGKAVYRFVVGKLNPAKLGNFPEIQVFVLIACPENALLSNDDVRSFTTPVATPYEALLACNEELEWRGAGVVSFPDLLRLPVPTAARAVSPPVDADTPSAGGVLAIAPSASGTLTAAGALVSSAAEFFASSRAWKGMAFAWGEGEGDVGGGAGEDASGAGDEAAGDGATAPPPAYLQTQHLAIGQGRVGVAAGYAGEGGAGEADSAGAGAGAGGMR